MDILLNTGKVNKKSKHKLQARFDKLRQQIQKQQKLNRKFQSDLEALVTLFQSELTQLDRKQLQPLISLTEKLIEFYRRKSLTLWQREELGEWIVDNIIRVGHVEPDTADRLQASLRHVIAQQMRITEEELDRQAQQQADAMKEAFETFQDDDNSAEEYFQPDIFGFGGTNTTTEADESYFYEDDLDRQAPDHEERKRRFMDGSWARSLFRRAAQALHPDREQDPEQRQSKQRSMQELLQARKDGDILTLLNLYAENASGDHLILAEQEMQHACELLQQQCDELRQENSLFIEQHPLRAVVLELLYSPSSKIQERNIRAWRQSLKAETSGLRAVIEELRNLTVLKSLLRERRDDRLYHDAMALDDIWD